MCTQTRGEWARRGRQCPLLGLGLSAVLEAPQGLPTLTPHGLVSSRYSIYRTTQSLLLLEPSTSWRREWERPGAPGPELCANITWHVGHLEPPNGSTQ